MAVGVKISELEAAATLTGAELVPVVQGGETVETTTQAIADLADTGVSAFADLTGNPTDNTALNALIQTLATLLSPAFTGNPTAPTQTAGNNSTRLANTAFVTTAVANAVASIINGAPGALDALNELATAMGNDPAFATTVINAIAAKVSDTAYGGSWDGVTTVAPSKNAVRDQVEILLTAIAAKQAELVSGTNIKTINGTSVLGAGDIEVGASHTAQTLTDGATVTMNYDNGDVGSLTISGDRALVVTNVTAPAFVVIKVTQGTGGNHTLTLPGNVPADFALSTGAGEVDVIGGAYIGGAWFWDFANYGTVIAPDVTAPTVVSRTATDANTIRIVFSEAVTGTIAGFSFNNGGALTVASRSGSGTTTWDFTITETMTSADTITASYNSGTGDAVDGSSNDLASFTTQAVTNSIPAVGAPTPFNFDELTNASRAGDVYTASASQARAGHSVPFRLAGQEGSWELEFRTSLANDVVAGASATMPSGSVGFASIVGIYQQVADGNFSAFNGSSTGGTATGGGNIAYATGNFIRFTIYANDSTEVFTNIGGSLTSVGNLGTLTGDQYPAAVFNINGAGGSGKAYNPQLP